MKPLSEQLAEMSATAKDVEDAVAQARQERGERLDAMATEARANSDAIARQVDQNVDAAEDAIVSGWRRFQDTLRADTERMQADVAAKKYAHDADRARAAADAAERHAKYAIAVASMAIWQANEVALEAIKACAEADSY